MASEADLQEWFEKHARRGTLIGLIGQPEQDDPWQRSWAVPPDAGLDLEDKVTAQAADDVCRICDTLIESTLELANEDMKLANREIYKPDLVFHNSNSNTYIIFELKVERTAERQALTELVAYAEMLRRKLNGPDIYLVVASQVWKPLLQRAVSGYIRSGGYPVLPLIVAPADAPKAEPTSESNFELAIFWDLLKDHADKPSFSAQDFVCDTITYSLPHHRPRATNIVQLTRQVVVESVKLANRAHESGNRPGFVLVWAADHESVNITTSILNPARLPRDVPPDSPLSGIPDRGKDGIPYAGKDPSSIDDGDRLLRGVDIETEFLDVERSGFSDWPQAHQALQRWRAQLVYAQGWGDARDIFNAPHFDGEAKHCSNLALSVFPLHHPFLWIPRWDRFTGTDFSTGDLSRANTLCALGSILGEVNYFYARHSDSSEYSLEFGFQAATARLIDAWATVYAARSKIGWAVPPIPLNFEHSVSTVLKVEEIDRKRHWCREHLCSRSKWHRFAFYLGFAQSFAKQGGSIDLFYGEFNLATLFNLARQLLAWANSVKNTALDDGALGAWEHLSQILNGKPLTIDLVAWSECSDCLAVLADAAAANGLDLDSAR